MSSQLKTEAGRRGVKNKLCLAASPLTRLPPLQQLARRRVVGSGVTIDEDCNKVTRRCSNTVNVLGLPGCGLGLRVD